MSSGGFDWEMFFARLDAGELPPEHVPDEMVRAIDAGFDSPAVWTLAGLGSPTLRDLECHLSGLAAEIGCRRPTHRQALKLAGDELLRRIVDGARRPTACSPR